MAAVAYLLSVAGSLLALAVILRPRPAPARPAVRPAPGPAGPAEEDVRAIVAALARLARRAA